MVSAQASTPRGSPAKWLAIRIFSVHPQTWKLLLNYLPVNASRRQETLYMKRTSYRHAVDQYWKASDWSPDEEAVFRQISVDIPRTCPDHKLFHVKQVQEILQRILFVWALKHPASGYVQVRTPALLQAKRLSRFFRTPNVLSVLSTRGNFRV
mmetsp:Transcript_6181/g.26104  ORF Transcript_6181/g.26104 Transcript_6181/m.26104 type:complete len:153 (+) Transcript_6181:1149-1607(+)